MSDNNGATTTVQRQREFQREQDARDQAQADAKQEKERQQDDDKPVQAGARQQPDTLPPERLQKPGREADMQLQPQFMAPGYKGSGKLQGLTALITGGDSGIGRAVAVLFAREGADVAIGFLPGVEQQDADETQRCVEAEGQRCLQLPGDVRDVAWCNSAVQRTVDTFGKLDVLVNNAAFQLHASALEDLSDERIHETLDTNIGGYLRMARAALPHLKRGSSIVNTGSVTGLEGSQGLVDYSATKGAIHALTKALASQLLPRGIRVNAVAPGPVWTPLNPADGPVDKVASFGSKTDMHRAAQPEELSPAYVFLASPVCSGYISGIVLPVTGSVGAI